MTPIIYSFKISLQDYRKMLYFNTFSLKRLQILFIVAAWVSAATLLTLELLNKIEPTQIMHLCFLIVTVTVPMLIVSLEIRINRSKGSDVFDKDRTITFYKDGVKYNTNDKKTGSDSWASLLAIYETKSLFIIYKDNRHTVLVPKKGEESDKLESTRECLRENLGNRYHIRSNGAK